MGLQLDRRRAPHLFSVRAGGEGGGLRAAHVTARGLIRITPAWLRAFHSGFVVGWFAITSRSRYGRNPFRVRRLVEIWDHGQRCGAEARRRYLQIFSEISNEPRKAALLTGMPRGRHAGA